MDRKDLTDRRAELVVEEAAARRRGDSSGAAYDLAQVRHRLAVLDDAQNAS